jgi:epoxide hydrolase-like predicted phosphatase
MSSSRHTQGLLIDYGGVLTGPIRPVMTAFCRAKGLPEDALATIQRRESPFRAELEAYERGEYGEEEFLPRFAEALGLPGETLGDFFADLRPDETMFRAVAAIRNRGVPVGLLSNSWGPRGYPRDRLGEAFDVVVISGEVGMRKPEPGIYRHAAKLLGVEPCRCVFVDDTKDHLAGAAQQGMTVIHHQTTAQTLQKLEQLFGVELNGSALQAAEDATVERIPARSGEAKGEG